MKTRLITILLSILILSFSNLYSQNKTLSIFVYNPAKIEREKETITLKWDILKRHAPWIDSASIGVKDMNTKIELITQKVEDELIFQTNFIAKENKLITIFSKASEDDSATSFVDAKFVLPRQDITWENDRIAYRIYGSKLAGDVLSGIDVWVKRVRYKIIDKWYAGNALEGKSKISYHIDHGEGADFFTVGKSLGAGGCALWKDEQIHQSSLFTRYQIIATGPIRTKFVVFYEQDSLMGNPIVEQRIVTLDAGQNLNRIDVAYNGIVDEKKVKITVGLAKRKDSEISVDKKFNIMSLWGPTNEDSNNGYTGTAVIIPFSPIRSISEDNDNHLLITDYKNRKYLTYYAGACWTKSTDFESWEDWNSYLKNYSLRLKYPLKIKFVKTKKEN